MTEVKRVGAWRLADAADVVVLDAQDRHRRRIVFVGEEGATYLVDFPNPLQLCDGDGLLLEDGAMVRIAGKPEPLTEVTADTPETLARLAWHVGNRHTEIQFVGAGFRIRRDHVLDEMLRGLGARIAHVEAPFDPESGAYSHSHRHGNGHDA
ncbi:MAG: urease accessory protein UreE [Xanthobacteraceae bacterium]